MAIHHATIKRAARMGVQIIEADGKFRLVRIEDGLLSVDAYDSTAEALEEMERDECEFETEEEAEEGFAKCGVMVKDYHDEYSKNPHGPGCGDMLDISLRNATYITPEGGKSPRVDLTLLRQIGEAAGVWKTSWQVLNPGMQRMNLANRLRGFLRNNVEAMINIDGEVGRFGIEARTPKARKG